MAKVLVIDDQPDVREALRLLLKGAGYTAETAESPRQALAAAAYNDHDLILMDMNYTCDTTSGDEGLQLIERLHAQRSAAPIIAMTGWSTLELAVEAMQRGARDFIAKPWDNKHLLAMVDKHIKNDVRLEQSRDLIEAELERARRVQRKLMPDPRFRAGNLECECVCLPAGEISGDLYDFITLDDGKSAFLLGDVSGKGIGAALLMANLQATVRQQKDKASAPGKWMEGINQSFYQSTQPEHFATMFLGVYDARDSTIRYVNAGHPPAVLRSQDGSVALLESTALMVGAFRVTKFEEKTVRMEPGSRLVVFSDGLSESKLDSEEDGEWVVDAVKRLAPLHADGFAGALAAEADSQGRQADDITIMDVRVL